MWIEIWGSWGHVTGCLTLGDEVGMMRDAQLVGRGNVKPTSLLYKHILLSIRLPRLIFTSMPMGHLHIAIFGCLYG
jgi:hypothetical protein